MPSAKEGLIVSMRLMRKNQQFRWVVFKTKVLMFQIPP